jgi:hypothetical protein
MTGGFGRKAEEVLDDEVEALARNQWKVSSMASGIG